jgi:osmotically-inducible protein OsmY
VELAEGVSEMIIEGDADGTSEIAVDVIVWDDDDTLEEEYDAGMSEETIEEDANSDEVPVTSIDGDGLLEGTLDGKTAEDEIVEDSTAEDRTEDATKGGMADEVREELDVALFDHATMHLPKAC